MADLNPGDVRALYLGAGWLARLGRRKTALAWAARALGVAQGMDQDDPDWSALRGLSEFAALVS
jgi:hypothetical protein